MVCNVPIQLNGEVLAAYLSRYGDIKDITTNGTAHGDCFVTMCLNRSGFQAIPHTLEYEEQTMMVVVEGREPQWNYKQLGHFLRSCPQKTTKTTTPLTTTTMITTIAVATTKTILPTSGSPKTENGDHPDKKEDRWTQVTRGRKKKKTPLKKSTIVPTENQMTTNSITTATTVTTATKNSSSSSTTTMKNKEENTEAMDISINFRWRRDSEDSLIEEG